MYRCRIAALVAVLLALSGCAARQDISQLPVQEYAGHFTAGTDATWFEPCTPIAGSSRLWVTWVDRAVQQRREAEAAGRLAAGERVFVRWRAALTDEERVGPGGPALLVREVVELRPAQAGDCPAPTP